MIAAISKVGKLHKSGPKGRKRWRVKYWITSDSKQKYRYLGYAHGTAKRTKREAERLLARWVQQVGADPTAADQVALPTLREHVDHYFAMIEQRYASSSMSAIGLTSQYLMAYLGPNRRIDQVNPSNAEGWFVTLVRGHIGEYVAQARGEPNQCKTNGLADATVKHHLNNARQIFAAAVRRFPQHVRSNPFSGIRIKPKPSNTYPTATP